MRQRKNFLYAMAILSALAVMLTGCAQTKKAETEVATETEVITETVEETGIAEELVTMKAVIKELEGTVIVLEDEQGGSYQIETDGNELKDNQGKAVVLEDLEVGQSAEIVYNGITMRNIPATIPMVTSFTIVE